MTTTKIPVPKFEIGQKVWCPSTETTRGKHPCPDCQGSETWTATTAAGEVVQVQCVRCSGYGRARDLPSLDYTEVRVSVRPLTIGSISIKTHPHRPDEGVEYMCKETGVGSGSIWYEYGLFATHDEAEARAEVLRAEEQARFKEKPAALLAADFAKMPLEVALKYHWSNEIYHAWDRARDYRTAIEEVLDRDSAPLEDKETLEYAMEDRPWRSPHPVDALLDAAKEVIGGNAHEGLTKLQEAIDALENTKE